AGAACAPACISAGAPEKHVGCTRRAAADTAHAQVPAACRPASAPQTGTLQGAQLPAPGAPHAHARTTLANAGGWAPPARPVRGSVQHATALYTALAQEPWRQPLV